MFIHRLQVSKCDYKSPIRSSCWWMHFQDDSTYICETATKTCQMTLLS
ncbi:hypothetical protein HanIR_Chr15g0774831 [Helianthus annuus]|nr:hypothetical protein HanIR_Chr15g0774831 [Helianthus annuus]